MKTENLAGTNRIWNAKTLPEPIEAETRWLSPSPASTTMKNEEFFHPLFPKRIEAVISPLLAAPLLYRPPGKR
jgi:hypothetical protein